MQSTIPIMDPVFHLFQDLKTKRVYKNGCPVSTMSKILPLLSLRQPMSENFLKRLFGLIQIQNLNENAIIIVCRKGWVLYNLQTISISLWWDYYDMLRNQAGIKLMYGTCMLYSIMVSTFILFLFLVQNPS